MHVRQHLSRVDVPLMSVMRSTCTRMLVVVILVLSTLGTTTLVASPAANASSATFANQLEAAIHKYTNAQRRAQGRRAVVRGPCVDRYAEGWATHLASTGQFYHRSWRTIVRHCHKSYASENIAWYLAPGASADTLARKIVQMWMNSPGHRVNLLSSRARVMGVGAAKSRNGRWFVVQNFAS